MYLKEKNENSFKKHLRSFISESVKETTKVRHDKTSHKIYRTWLKNNSFNESDIISSILALKNVTFNSSAIIHPVMYNVDTAIRMLDKEMTKQVWY